MKKLKNCPKNIGFLLDFHETHRFFEGFEIIGNNDYLIMKYYKN